jgi:phosphoglycerate dehydrogenase-like enzyme
MVKVLINYEMPTDLRKRVQSEIDDSVTLVFAENEERAKLEIVDAEILFGSLTLELFNLSKKLRWVQTPIASLENYMFPELIESDILMTNVAGIYNEEIADHVFALILGITRQIPRFTRNQDKRYWEPASDFKVDCLQGKTLGIIGLGGIGGEVARRGPCFGMRVVATRANPEREKPDDVDQVWGPDKLEHLLTESDFVVICTPETPRTRKMISGRELEAMKRTAYIINIGRGAVVDLTALTDALKNRVIAGAGLDVFEEEPLPSHHSLWDMENVIITPHMASVIDIYPARRVDIFIQNLTRYLKNKPLMNIVDKADWH